MNILMFGRIKTREFVRVIVNRVGEISIYVIRDSLSPCKGHLILAAGQILESVITIIGKKPRPGGLARKITARGEIENALAHAEKGRGTKARRDTRCPVDDGSYGSSRTSSWTWPCLCRARGLIWQRRHSGISVGARRTFSSRCRRCANATCLPAAAVAAAQQPLRLPLPVARIFALSFMFATGHRDAWRRVASPFPWERGKKKEKDVRWTSREKWSPVSLKRLLVPPPRCCRISSLEISPSPCPAAGSPCSLPFSLPDGLTVACRQWSDVMNRRGTY